MTNANFRLEHKERVEILGVVGAGKTTLARRLAQDQRAVLAERHDHNLFWDDQRATNALGHLPCDLTFLLQHAHLVASATSGTTLFCDWSLLSDWLWASVRLGEELDAYEAVHRSISGRLGQPLGYLYLKQPVEVIVARLVKRGREAEAAFTEQVSIAAERLDVLVQTLPPERVLCVGDDVSAKAVAAWVATARASR